jgi:large subunit ribosomal protein LP0
MAKEDRTVWKDNYFFKIISLFDEYQKAFIVNADNVGSKQMQQIRQALRGKAVILMGKNTMMRKAIRGHLENSPGLERLLPVIKNNVGFVFTKEDLTEVRTLLLDNKVQAPARAGAGAVVPMDVKIPAQITTLGPEKTSFFQALSIPTKITKGTIEILNIVSLIKEGEKVGQSERTLLNMLNVSPFTYGLVIENVYDPGTVFAPNFLNINAGIISRFVAGVRNVACVSLAIGYPMAASAPHSLINGFKRLLAIAAETDYTFKESERTKEYLKDPSRFAVAASKASPAAAKTLKGDG